MPVSDTADILNIASGETVLIIEVRITSPMSRPTEMLSTALWDKTTEWNQKKYKGGK